MACTYSGSVGVDSAMGPSPGGRIGKSEPLKPRFCRKMDETTILAATPTLLRRPDIFPCDVHGTIVRSSEDMARASRQTVEDLREIAFNNGIARGLGHSSAQQYARDEARRASRGVVFRSEDSQVPFHESLQGLWNHPYGKNSNSSASIDVVCAYRRGSGSTKKPRFLERFRQRVKPPAALVFLQGRTDRWLAGVKLPETMAYD